MRETSPKETETSVPPSNAGADECLEKLPADVKEGIDTDEAVLAMIHRYFPGTVEVVENTKAEQEYSEGSPV